MTIAAASSRRDRLFMEVSYGPPRIGRGSRQRSGEGGARPFLGIKQLDVADTRGAAVTPLDGLDQAKKEVVGRARPGDGVSLGNDEVQDGDALEAVAYV